MTRQEWVECVGAMKALWPNYDPGPDDLRVTYAFVESMDKADVLAAINSIALDGGEFAPPVGKIVRRIAEKHDRTNILPFAQAWRLVEKAVNHAHQNERAGLEWLEVRSPAVARWAASYGWDALRLEPVADPERGPMIRARMERSYVASCEDYRAERADGVSLARRRIQALGGGPQVDHSIPGLRSVPEIAEESAS